ELGVAVARTPPSHACGCARHASSPDTLPRPRRLTLFPYTTLFRSHIVVEEIRRAGLSEVWQSFAVVTDTRTVGVRDGGRTYGHLDRKSTRLNSSHVKISYAVFCLKKKKHTNLKHKYA